MTDESCPIRIGLLGGFLGAGKTTAIIAIGKEIMSSYNKKVAVITNDQGEVLVDTKIIQNLGFSAAEVVGGCFCCRFPDFITAVDGVLSAVNPDIILAEPVGSCADLPATVCEPLKRYYSGKFVLAPFIVLVDPHRVASLMGDTDNTDNTDSDINFLLFHQIQEAEILVINKIDLVSREEIEKIDEFLSKVNGRAHIYSISAEEGTGICELVKVIMEGAYRSYAYPEIDYKKYSIAEAALGWFNSSCVISADKEIDIKMILEDFLKTAAQKIREKKGEITHLKVHFENEDGFLKASMVSGDGYVGFTGSPPLITQNGTLSINARISLDPSSVGECMKEAFRETEEKHEITSAQWDTQCFSPPEPEPYYRILTK
ncbi:MAG: hypothetical protein HXS44_13950 [Theionarchaea archaeon]|nr:hypothetical protein [Theionarchaea archaeon]